MYISTHANNNNSSVFPVFLYLWSYILVHLMTMSTRQKQFARFKTVWSLTIQSNQQKSQMPARNKLLAIHFMLHIKAPHYWSWRPYSRFLSPWQAGGWNMIEWKKKKYSIHNWKWRNQEKLRMRINDENRLVCIIL